MVPKPVTPPAPSRSPRKRLDSKARRAPPPPPTATTPTTQAPPTSTQSEPLKEEPLKEEPSPTKAKDTKPPTPTPQIRKTSTAAEAVKTTRSFSTAQPNSTQPMIRPRKRLTTTAGGTQRRQPPPPPPSAAKVATPPVTPSHQATSSDTTMIASSTSAEEVKAPASETKQVKIPPVPPRSSLRPRVQRVKRPISRMIPPPPNIPLPPPPIRKASKIEETIPAINNSEKRKSIDKPSVAPKPAHLRRYSTPTSPTVAQTNTEPLKSPKPKPPPPMRTSSLATRPVPPVRKVPAPSHLPKIKDESEEVDPPQEIAENTINDKAARSAPPRRPPPPRPPSAASGKINKIEEQPSGASAVPAGGRVLYNSSDAQPEDKDGRGHSIRSKGSNLMQSLKKMVTRDSKKGAEKKAVPVSSVATKTTRDEATDITTSKQDSFGTKPARPPPPKTPPTQQKRDSLSSRLLPPNIGTEKETKPTPAPRQSEPDPSQPKAAPRLSLSDPPQKPQPTPVPRQEPDPPQPKPAPRKSEPALPQLMPNGGEEIKPTPVPRLVETPSQDTKPTPLPRQRSVSPDEKSHGADVKPQDQSTASPDLGLQVSTSPSDANFYRATMKYEAMNDKELSFSKGDVLIIVQKQDDGFHYGMLDDGTTGLFPLHAVEPFLS